MNSRAQTQVFSSSEFTSILLEEIVPALWTNRITFNQVTWQMGRLHDGTWGPVRGAREIWLADWIQSDVPAHWEIRGRSEGMDRYHSFIQVASMWPRIYVDVYIRIDNWTSWLVVLTCMYSVAQLQQEELGGPDQIIWGWSCVASSSPWIVEMDGCMLDGSDSVVSTILYGWDVASIKSDNQSSQVDIMVLLYVCMYVCMYVCALQSYNRYTNIEIYVQLGHTPSVLKYKMF
jgi:hypothetical protein